MQKSRTVVQGIHAAPPRLTLTGRLIVATLVAAPLLLVSGVLALML